MTTLMMVVAELMIKMSMDSERSNGDDSDDGDEDDNDDKIMM
jgi:hypothetical protein